MHDWDLIECPEPIPMSYAGPEPSMSQWTGINLGSLDENVKIVQATQTNLIKLLEKLGYEVIPISMKHQRTLGGGPHCCTVELEMEYNQ
jgi:glycine amidinotransferase/scyllo-inosamine-4-phosphate amidinotransferase 1